MFYAMNNHGRISFLFYQFIPDFLFSLVFVFVLKFFFLFKVLVSKSLILLLFMLLCYAVMHAIFYLEKNLVVSD